MTWQYDNNDDSYEPPKEPEGKRGASFVIAGAFVLAIIGTGSAFAWRAYVISTYTAYALGAAAGTEHKAVGLDEFRAFQQQIAGQLQSNGQLLVAQQAEVKRLSDQMAAVSAKMDVIQSSIASSRATISNAPPTSTQLKRLVQPKPAPRISTGGAPLPPPIH